LEEIIKREELHNKLINGVNKLADVVVTTLGPNGSTVIIADGYDEPYITKDGVSVSNYTSLKDPVENIAATLLKQVAKNTVEQAGDGTTTSICLAQALINTGYILIASGLSYNTIKKSLEELEEYVVKELVKNAKKLKTSNIIDVATISSNNDKKIGNIIQTAYNHSLIVKVEEGTDLEDKLVTISGMELKTGYFNNAFINKPSKQSIVYDEPYLLLINGKLDKLDNIGKLLLGVKESPIIIVADYFGDQVLSILKDNYNRGALKVGLMKSPGFAGHRKNLMEDISKYSGATLLDPNTKYTDMSVLGKLKHTSIGKDKTIITSENNISEDHLNNLKEILKNSTETTDKHLLTERIENLTGNISIIKVGGKSEVEMKERKDRIDDAVLAVSCALEEGIIEGGGKALQLIASTTNNKFVECLYAPKLAIVNNGAVIDYTEDFFEKGIIDPVKVTRVAIQNAISVAKTILGTNAVVLNERLWK